MIKSIFEKSLLIPNEIANSYKALFPFLTGKQLYFLIAFLVFLTISYFIYNLKIRPIVEKRLPLNNIPFYIFAYLILLVSPNVLGYKNPILLACSFFFLFVALYALSLTFTSWLSHRKPFFAKQLEILIKFSILLLTLLFLIRSLGISKSLEDVTLLILKIGIFAIVIHALFYREEILSLFPEIEVAFYKKIREIFRKFYFLVLLFVSAVGGLWIIGYEDISKSLFWRFLGLIGFIIGLSKLHQLAVSTIREKESLSPISRETYLLWLYIELILSSVIILKLLGIYNLLATWLDFPLATIGEAPLYLSQLLKATLIGIFFYIIASLIRKLTESRGEIITENLQLRKILSKVFFYTFILIGLLASLRALGVGPSFLAVFAGTLGIGLGLGLQDLARNIVGGILIFMEGHFKVNDIITLSPNSSSPITGRIEKIDYRCVTLRTFDNIELIIPSSLLASDIVMNWTKSDTIIRKKLSVGVSYNSDPRHVERVILEEVKKHPGVLPEPEPFVVFREMGESALIFDIFIWIDQSKASPLKVPSDLNFSIWYRFKEEGIEIPYPQLDVHLKDK